MSLYDSSDSNLQQREYLGTKVYMASHPALRPFVRGNRRPTEFGDRVWDMTLAMMRYLDGVALGHVFDVGCGWGLLGIHLARNRANRVTCVDIDENLRPIVELNSRLNGVDVGFRTSSFGELSFENETPDAIVAAEVCYCEAVRVELSDMMDKASRSGVKQAIVADLGRPDFFDLIGFCKDRYDIEMSQLVLETHAKPRPVMRVRF